MSVLPPEPPPATCRSCGRPWHGGVGCRPPALPASHRHRWGPVITWRESAGVLLSVYGCEHPHCKETNR